jgi:hypothetical protein
MDQNDTPTPDTNPPNPKKTARLPQVDLVEFTRARIFLFILLIILILLFNANPIIVSIITTILILLSIDKMFGPIANVILKYTDKLISILFKPLEWLWLFLFVRHRTSLGDWLKRHRQPVIYIIVIIAILTLLGTTTLRPTFMTESGNLNDYACLNTDLPWPTCNPGLGVSTLPNGVRIGLIASNTSDSPFDQSTLNQDETKVEKLIFAENLHGCTGQHITLIVLTMLSRTVEDPLSSAKVGLQELQGSYLAQLAHNTTRPQPTVKICLAIANMGTADTASKESKLVKSYPDNYSLPRVIHQIAQLVHTDSTVRGIVGLPYSQQTTEALDLIKGYRDLSAIPIISGSASGVLADTPNLYLIASPNHSQGAALAQFFCDRLKQSQSSDSIAMLRDDQHAYSSNFQSEFNNAVTSINCIDPAHKKTIPYATGDADSIRKAVYEALGQHFKYILFPDYDQNMDTVELEIHQVLQDHASDITILGGGAINNLDTTTHFSYTHVYATSSTGPLPKTDPIAKSFIEHEFSKPLFENAIPSKLWIPKDTLQTYDEVKAFAQIIRNLHNGDLPQVTFNKILANISFEGASDQVTFQGYATNGHRSEREQGYVYITCNDYAHNLHLITKYITVNDDTNNPARNLPLSQAEGASICT